MLSTNSENLYKTFPNYFLQGPKNPLCQIYSLGWQMRTSVKYNWDGMKRPDEKGQCIFQYSLSGFGMLEYDNKSFKLGEGDAFIVMLPDKHRYYLPAESKKWEFFFITLTGAYAVEAWRELQQLYGKVIKLNPKSQALQFLWKSYWDFAKGNVTNGYETSSIAYTFIMQLFKSLDIQANSGLLERNDHIVRAIEFMKSNLHRPLNLEDLAQAANLSKYHFSRLFTSVMGITPWNYLTQIRMEKAGYLLQTQAHKIHEIAEMVGYSTVNYFDKVFRKSFGTSPGYFERMYQGVDAEPVNKDVNKKEGSKKFIIQ